MCVCVCVYVCMHADKNTNVVYWRVQFGTNMTYPLDSALNIQSVVHRVHQRNLQLIVN